MEYLIFIIYLLLGLCHEISYEYFYVYVSSIFSPRFVYIPKE